MFLLIVKLESAKEEQRHTYCAYVCHVYHQTLGAESQQSQHGREAHRQRSHRDCSSLADKLAFEAALPHAQDQGWCQINCVRLI